MENKYSPFLFDARQDETLGRSNHAYLGAKRAFRATLYDQHRPPLPPLLEGKNPRGLESFDDP